MGVTVILLLPLVIATLIARAGAGLLARKDRRAQAWSTWPAAAGIGVSVVFVSASVTHFIEPQRSGLIAIVPDILPAPDLIVTASGVLELALAAGLVVPRTRRVAAVAAVVLLVLMFPANIVAAAGVDNPAAPSTPLVPRAIAQLVFVVAAVIAALPGRARGTELPGAGGGR
ncbi:hypothetical protein GCM10009808_11510 [Microbacterium sediminicola]|uniref:DoxX-like family protein n=1 Tax=Microbacterium sediminicola TaxID=415210 RepID=A0ABN2HZ93_9MICO